MVYYIIFFFKQKTAYEMRISDWSSDVCSSDLSAGTYNLLQPELATQLRDRKAANIASTNANAVAAGNIGCLVQIGGGLEAGGRSMPVLHTEIGRASCRESVCQYV